MRDSSFCHFYDLINYQLFMNTLQCFFSKNPSLGSYVDYNKFYIYFLLFLINMVYLKVVKLHMCNPNYVTNYSFYHVICNQ